MQWETSKSPVITTRSVRYKFDARNPYAQYIEPVPENSGETYVEVDYPRSLLPEEEYNASTEETESEYTYDEDTAGQDINLVENVNCNDEEQDMEVNNDYITDFEEEYTELDCENNADDADALDEHYMEVLNDHSTDTEVSDNVSGKSFINNMDEISHASTSSELHSQTPNLPSPLFYWKYPYLQAGKSQP